MRWPNALLGASVPEASVDEPGERTFAIGDIVIARRNDYATGLSNGQRGQHHHTDQDRGTVTVRTNVTHVVVGSSYLAAGGLDHRGDRRVRGFHDDDIDQVARICDESRLTDMQPVYGLVEVDQGAAPGCCPTTRK